MDGKVVVVTGALGALGKVVARSHWRAARGSPVSITRKRKLRRRRRGSNSAGSTFPMPRRPRQAIDAAASHFGRLDALINIAGGFAFETVAEGDSKTWQRMYALNVATALNASRAALPHLANSGAGRIVNIGAMGALQAGAGMGAYAASKAGVHRLTEALAAEWKGKITVNAVLPSTIDTAANRASMPNCGFRQMGDAAGTGRGDPVSRKRRRQRRHRRADPGERTGLRLKAPTGFTVPP